MRTVGGAFGAAGATAIIAAHTSASGLPTEQGYRAAFLASAAGGLLAIGAALLIPSRRMARMTETINERVGAVLPAPASPRMTSTPLSPPRASSSSRSSTALSLAHPSNTDAPWAGIAAHSASEAARHETRAPTRADPGATYDRTRERDAPR
jgi:hypothetical protein